MKVTIIIHFVHFVLYFSSDVISIKQSFQDESYKYSKYSIDFLSTVLSDCSSVIVHDHVNLPIDFFAKVNSFPSSNHYLFDLASLLELKYNIQNKSNSGKVLIDLHQVRLQCTTVLISINVKTLTLFETVSQITSKLQNIASTNKDYFVFHMSSEAISSLFLSPEKSQEIKHKIGVTTSELILSACIYCNNGSPKFKPLFLTQDPQKSELFPNYLTNFHQKQLRISTPTECKWLTEIRLEHGVWIPKRGIYNFVILEIMKRLNFSLEFFPSMGGGGTGFRYPNGTWIGIVGDLLAKNADLGQAAGQTLSRNGVIDYSSPITYEWLTFTTGEPRRFYSWRAVYRPLSTGVWGFFLLSGCFMVFIFFIFLKNTEKWKIFKSNKTIGISHVSRLMLKSLVEQGDDILFSPSTSTTFKILSLFWLLFVLVVMTAYKSKLVGFLAFPEVEIPPDTFDALAKSSSYKILLQYTGAAFSLFKSSTNPTYVKIFEAMKIEKSDVKCFEEAIHTKAGCISWANIVDYVAYKNLSDPFGRTPLVKAPAAAYFLLGGILMRKRAIYREEISNYVKQSMDSGLLEKWRSLDAEFVLKERREWEKGSGRKQNSYAQTAHDPLTLKHLSGSFFILMAGVVTAFCVFAREFYRSWRRDKILIETGNDLAKENFNMKLYDGDIPSGNKLNGFGWVNFTSTTRP